MRLSEQFVKVFNLCSQITSVNPTRLQFRSTTRTNTLTRIVIPIHTRHELSHPRFYCLIPCSQALFIKLEIRVGSKEVDSIGSDHSSPSCPEGVRCNRFKDKRTAPCCDETGINRIRVFGRSNRLSCFTVRRVIYKLEGFSSWRIFPCLQA